MMINILGSSTVAAIISFYISKEDPKANTKQPPAIEKTTNAPASAAPTPTN